MIMGNFKKENKFGGGRGAKKFGGGGRSFGGDRGGNRGFGGGRDGDRPEMHKATCSNCGNICEVPFRPTGDKPVFCNDCFKNKREGSSRNFKDGGKRDFGNRESKPRFGDKRPYQSDAGRNTENYKAQFEQLNAKLDKILKVLAPAIPEETRNMEVSKSNKSQKAHKKEVDTAALKEVITKTIKKEPTAKKAAAKKPAAKKKTSTKKTPAKKKKK